MQRAHREQELHHILVAQILADYALAAASLGAERLRRHALDVAAAGDGNQQRLVRHHVFGVELLGGAGCNARAALVAILARHVQRVFAHHLQDFARVLQQLLQKANALHGFRVLGLNLEAFQRCNAPQLQVQNCLRLQFVQLKARHQLGARIIGVVRLADGFHHGIDVADGREQAGQNVRPLARLAQLKLAAARNDLVAVVHKQLQ